MWALLCESEAPPLGMLVLDAAAGFARPNVLGRAFDWGPGALRSEAYRARIACARARVIRNKTALNREYRRIPQPSLG